MQGRCPKVSKTNLKRRECLWRISTRGTEVSKVNNRLVRRCWHPDIQIIETECTWILSKHGTESIVPKSFCSWFLFLILYTEALTTNCLASIQSLNLEYWHHLEALFQTNWSKCDWQSTKPWRGFSKSDQGRHITLLLHYPIDLSAQKNSQIA